MQETEDRPTISPDSTAKKEEKDAEESRVLNTFLKPFYISQQGPQNPQESKKVLVNKKKSYITMVVVLQTSILAYKIPFFSIHFHGWGCDVLKCPKRLLGWGQEGG